MVGRYDEDGVPGGDSALDRGYRWEMEDERSRDRV
jgi:hypothetical protein